MQASAIKVLVISLFLVSLLGVATIAYAQAPLVPTCAGDDCGAADFFILLDKIIKYFVFTLAVPVATIAIVYAGIIMASNPGKEGKRTEGKEIIEAAVIGLVLVIGAWLIVTTIVKSLVKPEFRSSIERVVPLGN